MPINNPVPHQNIRTPNNLNETKKRYPTIDFGLLLKSKRRLIPERSKEIAEIAPTSVTQGAENAFDKDLTTGYTDVNNGGLKVEFDQTYFINNVVIYHEFYTNFYDPSRWCAQSEANFRTCVDERQNVNVSVYQGEVQKKSCGTLQLTYGLDQSDQFYKLICNAKGDTVKLSNNTGRILLLEVVVTVSGKSLANL